MIEMCRECDEPATFFLGRRGPAGEDRTALWYRHSVACGLAESAPAWVEVAAEQASVSVNAIMFLLGVLQSRPESCNSAASFCISTWDVARQVCGPNGERALRCWNIHHGRRLASILQVLGRMGAVEIDRDALAQVCNGLKVVGEFPIA
jgi:hypothetical protein